MNEMRNRFKDKYPEKYFVDQDDLGSMTEYLISRKFLNDDEHIVSAEVPGAGNMNYVLRVKTNVRSFILKQSRPWVEKYPSIDAPVQRIEIEAKYYDHVKTSWKMENHSPKIYDFDLDNYILLMEDLGEVKDFTSLYESGDVIGDEDIITLANYLHVLHSVKANGFPDNMEMRKLNHTHIFNFPFDSNNGFDLDTIHDGLGSLTVNELTDPKLVEVIRNIGDLYLGNDGGNLLHGDFYPGSWMKSHKLFVLDAEFGFVGPAEFDLGIFIAHMKMSFQTQDKVSLFLHHYDQHNKTDLELAGRFAGIEILRRLLGVAQLPLQLTIEQKAELIAEARAWIMS